MAVVATARPAIVPRLALPSREEADDPAFRRQIMLALGSSHGRRSARRDVVFHVRHGRMLEKQRIPSTVVSSVTARECDGGRAAASKADEPGRACQTARPSAWVTTNQHFAPDFSPSATNHPQGTWYEEADRVYRFFGHVVEGVMPTARRVNICPRLVIIHYYPQDATLEMMESKVTATAGVGRMMVLRRPSRVPLASFRVGDDVMVNGTRVHLYDADAFTRRCFPDMRPPEQAPETDTTFSITPRRHAPPRSYREGSQGSMITLGPSDTCGGSSNDSAADRSWCPRDAETNSGSFSAGEFSADSLQTYDAPSTLRMYIRRDDSASEGGSVHLYILTYFLEDGTMEMRELADTKGGHHFQGRFPVMVRRQRVLKEGLTPSLSVDHIGAPSTFGHGGSIGGNSGARGGAGAEDRLTLSPHDMRVGQTVVLMKRPMVVWGWDETAHVWWENVTGVNMRRLQGDLSEFRRAMNLEEKYPQRPVKAKSSFYEGPPQRPGTVRGRFLKASENCGKTLRFLAKATPETQTVSTRESIFIIRYFPEDDTLSVFISHNLGKNAGGIQQGVYLARRGDVVNPETGRSFAAGDFLVGSVAKLPSVSLKILDVDDFSRHYLAQHQRDHMNNVVNSEWQTAPAWHKLLSATTGSCNGLPGHGESLSSETRAVRFGRASQKPSSSTCANGSTLGVNAVVKKVDDDCGLASALQEPVVGDKQHTPATLLMARCLWQRLAPGRVSPQPPQRSLSTLPRSPPPSNNPPNSPATPAPQNTPTWKQVLEALAERGVHTDELLTAHERTLLDRELTNWSLLDNGHSGAPWWGGGGGGSHVQASSNGFKRDPGSLMPLSLGEKTALSQASPVSGSALLLQGGDGDVVRKSTRGGSRSVLSEKASESLTGIFPAVVVEETLLLEPEQANASEEAQGVAKRKSEAGDRRFGNESCTAVPMRGRWTPSSGRGLGSGDTGEKAVVVKAGRSLDLREVAREAHEVPYNGREDAILHAALTKLIFSVFGHGGEAAIEKALKAEGKSPADPADLRTMCRILMAVAGLSCRDTEGVWLKFMPPAVALAEPGGRVTFAGFLESIRTFEACLRRGEVLGLTTIDPSANDAGRLVID